MRSTPGSVLLSSLKAYCFCGHDGLNQLNSIESLQLRNETEWVLLPLNNNLVSLNRVAAVAHDGKIILFGGMLPYHMYYFNENGELWDDLSHVDNIPGHMNRGTVISKDGLVYAVGTREEWKGEWRLQVF